MSKGNKPFHITKFFFFINADIRETGYRLSSFSGVISLNKKQSIKGMVNVQNVFKPLQKLQKNSGKP